MTLTCVQYTLWGKLDFWIFGFLDFRIVGGLSSELWDLRTLPYVGALGGIILDYCHNSNPNGGSHQSRIKRSIQCSGQLVF